MRKRLQTQSDEMRTIQPGSIIQGPNWPEPVEVKFIEETGGYVHLVGATVRYPKPGSTFRARREG